MDRKIMQRSKMLHLFAGAAVSLAAAAGSLAEPTDKQMGREMTDPRITDAINDALFEDEGVSAHKIDVSTTNGVVTLSGTVSSALADRRASRVAETVKGVRSVIDRVDVRPTTRTDASIEDDVIASLAADPATDSWELGATVNDGVVTLTGSVDSWQEKQLARRVAMGVRGVQEVRSELSVDYGEPRLDSEIESEIERALDWDRLVDDGLINVNVEDREATLSGVVGSAAEKQQAIADAWVRGVRDVRAESLKVESWARDDRFRRNKYTDKADPEVRDAIVSALVLHPRVISANVDVTVDEGKATLRGTVDSVKARRAAERVARNTVGVDRVDNNIKIRTGEDLSAGEIEQRVETALLRDPYVGRYQIDVSVVGDSVSLYGEVDSQFERAKADDVAASVAGVAEVNNSLRVDDLYDNFVFDPYIDDTISMYDFDWYGFPGNITTAQEDYEIMEDIHDELWWSPFVDRDEVNVAVEDGVATLTGTVETWGERSAARENAYEGGAVSVINRIEVEESPETDSG